MEAREVFFSTPEDTISFGEGGISSFSCCVNGNTRPSHSLRLLSMHTHPGYKVLFGGVPRLKDAPKRDQIKDSLNMFSKVREENCVVGDSLCYLSLDLSNRIDCSQSMSRTHLWDTMLTLIGDIYDCLKLWGTKGKLNPFVQVYSVGRPSLAALPFCMLSFSDKADPISPDRVPAELPHAWGQRNC